jgi:hypothetical protein
LFCPDTIEAERLIEFRCTAHDEISPDLRAVGRNLCLADGPRSLFVKNSLPIASTSNDFVEFRQAAPAAALSFGQGAYDGA